jgi:hypothetical protein
MVKKPHETKGFIAIVSLLVITTISMIFAMSILKDGVRNASSSLESIYYEKARINSNTCLEDTLVRIKREQIFTQNINYAIAEDESCSSTMIWLAPVQVAPNILERNLNLAVTGTSSGFSRTFNHVIRVTRYDVNYPNGELDYLNSIDILSTVEDTN